MIAFKKEDPVLKRSNKILTGVENRLSVHRHITPLLRAYELDFDFALKCAII